MSKKKGSNNTPADDLIASLLEDVNSSSDSGLPSDSNSVEIPDGYSAEEESSNQGFITPGVFPKNKDDKFKNGDNIPIGLSMPKEAEVKGPRNQKSEQFWSEVEKEISLPEIDLGIEIASAGTQSKFKGPSAGEGGYQSFDDLDKQMPALPADGSFDVDGMMMSGGGGDSSDDSSRNPKGDDRTVALDNNPKSSGRSEPTDIDKTIAVTAFAKRKKPHALPEEKVVIGMMKPSIKPGLVHTSVDASLAQAENLKIAQQRILDLEREMDRLRGENEELASAGLIIRQKSEDLTSKMLSLEKEKQESAESLEGEILILRGTLQFKESEVQKAKIKIEDLEIRLKNDFKKIRVRERELENRLELARAEKQALVRAKDDNILELQRKIDHVRAELETYRDKVQELNKSVEGYQDQMKRTVRALRLALTNLEVKDEGASPVHLKKAE